LFRWSSLICISSKQKGRNHETDSLCYIFAFARNVLDWFINRWYGEHAPRAWFDFFVAQLLTLRNIAAELEPRVILLDYPLQDILKDGFIDGNFCDSDPFHANEKYGALIVEQIAALL
jgi:hypothetical protein